MVEDLGRRSGVTQAATVLAATTDLTVGIGILPAGIRNAGFAAMELATLAQLIVGIGHGMPGRLPLGAARLRTTVDLSNDATSRPPGNRADFG
ncbi:hypothetical protein [Streptomyces sp. NPDC001348]